MIVTKVSPKKFIIFMRFGVRVSERVKRFSQLRESKSKSAYIILFKDDLQWNGKNEIKTI